jgi:DNA-binding transcriptional LysR family regulator
MAVRMLRTRRLPRLEVIEAFIEAAHAPSFRIAAERCALSPAAFSRRIQAFRDFAGREVFDRTPRGVQLTEAGRECLAALEPTYQAMMEAARDLGASGTPRRVTISLSHSLAVAWLIPRLERFRERAPQIDVAIQTTRSAEAIRSGAADLGICATDVDVAGLHAEHLLDIDVTPVASPEIAEDIRAGRRRLADHRLLAPVHAPAMWTWWADQVCADCRPLPRAEIFDMANALYEAAATGWGVAAGMSVTVAPHLQSRRLVRLGLPVARYPGAYRLVAKASRMRVPAVTTFWRWLVEEGRLQRRGLAFATEPLQGAAASSAAISASEMR